MNKSGLVVLPVFYDLQVQLAKRTLLTLKNPERDSKSIIGQVNIIILGDTPFKKKSSIIEWKRDLQLLLQCFFRLPLSVLLTLGEDDISYFQDCDPYSVNSSCTFPRKEIPNWFREKHRSYKSVSTLPPNLENDENWLGFVICAAFSVRASQANVLKYLDLGHHPILACQLQLSPEPFLCDVQKINGISPRNKFMWLYGRGFIWLQFIPHQYFKGRLNTQAQLEASFGTDLISSKVLAVQECSLRILYKQDVEEFKQTIIQCFTSFFDNVDLIRQYIDPSVFEDSQHEGKTTMCLGETSRNSKRLAPQDFGRFRNMFLDQNQLLDFNHSSIYNSCFPPNEIVEWFEYQSNGPFITIPLPPTLCSDATWIGLAFCASFSVLENPTAELDNMLDPGIPHHLTCYLETAKGSLEPLYNYCTTNEEFQWMHLGGFVWHSYIPRIWFSDQLNECGRLEASIVSSHGAFSVDKCGIRLVYYQHNDEEELKQTMKTSLSDIYKEKQGHEAAGTSRTSAADHQSGGNGTSIAIASMDQDFDCASTYNSCFPPDDIVEWFGHHSNGPSVKIPVPLHVYGESTNWIGLAFCAYFSVLDHSTANLDRFNPDIPHHLTCYLETDTGSLDYFHSYTTKNEEFKWLHLGLGGFIWVSYIPRRSVILDHHQSNLQASIGSDCPGLGVLKCGLRLLYQHDTEEFKKTIMNHCNFARPRCLIIITDNLTVKY